MSWYESGDQGAQKAQQDDKNRASGLFGPRRFWLKPDTSTRFIFLDTEGLIK